MRRREKYNIVVGYINIEPSTYHQRTTEIQKRSTNRNALLINFLQLDYAIQHVPDARYDILFIRNKYILKMYLYTVGIATNCTYLI